VNKSNSCETESKMKYEDIDKVYRSISLSGGLSNPKRLSKECKISRFEAGRYLATQNSHTRHKARRTKFQRRRVMSPGIDYLWQADIVFLPKYTSENDGYTCLLLVIDVFSKYAFAIPMRSKQTKEVIRSFSTIFESAKRRPVQLECDMGTEFWNESFKKWLSQHSIQMYHNFSDFGASVVERFNRTLCTKISRYLTLTNQQRYVEALPFLLQSYNNTVHSRTQCKPSEVDRYNEMDVWLISFNNRNVKHKKRYKFKLYDRVRIDKTRGIFEKGYWPSFTSELFEISEIIDSVPITYRIRGVTGDPISGIFYSQELSKVIVQ